MTSLEALSSACGLGSTYANVRPIRLYEINHWIGTFRQVWDFDMVDIVVLRENTEGLYSLLRRCADRAAGRDPYEPRR